YDGLFTTDKPVIFAYHGYPWLIHRLAYRRTGHRNLHVRAATVRQRMADVRTRHQAWIREHGTDLPEVADWTWNS
ncbi:phosphoketolase family protein, partial [Streptomyces sp. SAS_272]|uniref:phosphoketolase family protein n=1 Tax=Streptomyces sp. SAS_272 TaxID=3412747 RepID=UPI00403CFBA8